MKLAIFPAVGGILPLTAEPFKWYNRVGKLDKRIGSEVAILMSSNSVRPRGPENASADPEKIPCKFCQRLFKPVRPWQKFCSDKHRAAWHTIQAILDNEENKDDI